MNLRPLLPFLKVSCDSRNHLVKQAAESLTSQLLTAQNAEEVVQPTMHSSDEANKAVKTVPKDLIDQAFDEVMPDIKTDEENKSHFGKVASAYVSDVEVGSLPKDTQEDVYRFAPDCNKKTKLVLYGMVVGELKAKVDTHNYKAALKHVQEDIDKHGKRAAGDKFQDKVKGKYILRLNDSVIDGHHFIALADKLGISCSLKVLDLTPSRFQTKTAQSLLYVVRNHRRPVAA